MTMKWDAEIGDFLARLSHAQRELLALLATKRKLLEDRDHAALEQLGSREHELAEELQACQQVRSRLLGEAESAGLPASSLAELDRALAGDEASPRAELIEASRNRAQLIRHDCLTQWVAMQRTLLHLSQMLEIIATGGRPKPTYGNSCGAQPSGALMDQAV